MEIHSNPIMTILDTHFWVSWRIISKVHINQANNCSVLFIPPALHGNKGLWQAHNVIERRGRGAKGEKLGNEWQEERKKERRVEGAMGRKWRTVSTYHNHFAILNFSYTVCFFAIPFLNMDEFVSIQPNNRLRSTIKMRVIKR